MGGLRVTFQGVRGSTPCDAPDLARYGGNTSCVVVEAGGCDPIIFDLGTGLRNYGLQLAAEGKMNGFRGSALLSHLHWDHVQGLPFFVPLHCEDSMLDVYGPRQSDGPLAEVYEGLMRPPYFPIRPEQLGGSVSFHDVGDDDFPIGDAKVRSRWIRHVGPTLGYRLDWHGVSIAYLSDHSQVSKDHVSDDHVPDDVLDLCDGVDLLIHDAQHTPSEFEAKRHWGHCTNEYAVEVARQAGVQRLALFHHDPIHTDEALDMIAQVSREQAAGSGVNEVFAAAEGLQIQLAPAHTAPAE